MVSRPCWLVLLASGLCSIPSEKVAGDVCVSSVSLFQQSKTKFNAKERAERHSTGLLNLFSGFPEILHVGTKSPENWEFKASFKRSNPGWKCDFLTDQRIRELLQHFPHEKAVVESHGVSGVELSDIGRLLSIQSEGGAYADADVQFHIPVKHWLASYDYSKDADMVVGIEFPRPDEFHKNPLQIANFCMASKPNNPILQHVLGVIMRNLEQMPNQRSLTLIRTGPVALTSAILEIFNQSGVVLPDVEQAFNQGEGKMFSVLGKRVVVLPYRAFGYNYLHGSDMNKGHSQDQLVEHYHRSGWF